MKTPAWPEDADVAFVIKDDDVSYFTKTWMLKEIYSPVWEMGFKTSFSTIPKHKAINDLNVPPEFRGKNTYQPISQNRELVDFLRRAIHNGWVDIIQHGFSHETINGTPEFGVKDPLLIEDRLFKGLDHLSSTFKRGVSVFVPPWDELSEEAIKVIQQSGVSICRSAKNWIHRLPSPIYSPPFYLPGRSLLATKYACLGERSTRISRMGNDVLEIRPSLVFMMHNSKLEADQMFDLWKKSFTRAYQRKDCFTISYHYWDFYYDWEDEMTLRRYHECFLDFLEYVNSLEGVWKTTLTEIRDWTLSELARKWDLVPLGERIEDLHS